MFVELQEDVDELVGFAPDQRGTAATVSLVPPGSTTPVYTGAATPVTVLSTVTAVGTSPDVLTFDTVAGMSVWDEVWYESVKGWRTKARPVQIAGMVVTFRSGPPGPPSVGDVVRGLKFTATIPAASLVTRETHYKLYWDVTEVSGAKRRYLEMAAVVAQRFREPVLADEVRALAADCNPGWAAAKSYGFWRELAEDSSRDVRDLLEAVENYPHLIGNHGAFTAAGKVAAEIRLLKLGVGPKDMDPDRYREKLIEELPHKVSAAVGGSWVDRNEDKLVSKGEVMGIQSARIVRA